MARNIAQLLLCLALPTNWLVMSEELNHKRCIAHLTHMKMAFVVETTGVFCTNEWYDTLYLNRVDLGPRFSVQMLANSLQEIGWSVM